MEFRSVSITLLAVSFFCLSGSIIFFGIQLLNINRSIPEILIGVEKTTEEIENFVKETEHVRRLIPPIIDESMEAREQIRSIVKEASEFRKQIPDILEKVEKINQQIPAAQNGNGFAVF